VVSPKGFEGVWEVSPKGFEGALLSVAGLANNPVEGAGVPKGLVAGFESPNGA